MPVSAHRICAAWSAYDIWAEYAGGDVVVIVAVAAEGMRLQDGGENREGADGLQARLGRTEMDRPCGWWW